MSWDTRTSTEPCPCGKSTILIVDRDDDWNRHEHRQEMQCPECARGYKFVKVGAPMRERCGWIPNEIAAKRDAEEKQRDAALAEATARAQEALGARLIQKLGSLRSRKAVWEKLQTFHIRTLSCWSFAEFNRRVRDRGREDAIRSIIDTRNVESVQKFLESKG